jgi:hypothetical protein
MLPFNSVSSALAALAWFGMVSASPNTTTTPGAYWYSAVKLITMAYLHSSKTAPGWCSETSKTMAQLGMVSVTIQGLSKMQLMMATEAAMSMAQLVPGSD